MSPRARPPDELAEIDEALDQAQRDERRLGPFYRDTLLPEGALVVVRFVDVEVGVVNQRQRWFGRFQIVEYRSDPSFVGCTLLRPWNAPKPGWLSPRHALYQDLVAVTGLRPRPIPSRPPRAVLGGYLRDVHVEARTRIVARRMDTQRRAWVATPSTEHYSVIDRLVRRVAGCPRVLQRREDKRKAP